MNKINRMYGDAAERLGLGRGLGGGSKWTALPAKVRRAELAKQREIEAAAGYTPVSRDPEDAPPVLRREIVNGEKVITNYGEGRAWLRRQHLGVRQTGELTGADARMCDCQHIDAWKDCEKDEDKLCVGNTFFDHVAINRAFSHFDHYLDIYGQIQPGKYGRDPALEALGVYDQRLKMTAVRMIYAHRAMDRRKALKSK